MKHLVIVLVLVYSAFAADQKAEIAAVLERAKQFATWNPNAVVEIQGKIKLYNTGSGTIDGTFRYLQNGKLKRTDVQASTFRQTLVAADKMYLTANDRDNGSIAINKLFELFPLDGRPEPLPTDNVRIESEKVNGVAVQCVANRTQRRRDCYREDGSWLLAEGWHWRLEYDDYADVSQLHIPRHIKVTIGDRKATELWITKASADVAAPATEFSIKREAFSAVVDRCDGKRVEPKPIFKPTPTYPPGARVNGISGATTVELAISSMGEPTSARMLQSSIPELNRAALESVRQWIFQPATCDDKPISSMSEVTVHFALKQR